MASHAIIVALKWQGAVFGQQTCQIQYILTESKILLLTLQYPVRNIA
jgi:hypothetical protein